MEKWVFFLLALINLKTFAQDQPNSWTRIDCGADRSTAANGLIWQTDETFIKTGTNDVIPDDSLRSLSYLNTLRVFKDQNKNCYTLPAIATTRYLIRAVFFYANYDGLSNPPSFDLEIDGNKIASVVSSSSEVRYYEIVYLCRSSNISVCLARTRSGEFPFISSLESWSIPQRMYSGMNQDLAWLNTYRYNYGADLWITGYPGDTYNRIWEPMSAGGAVNTSIPDPGLEDYTNEYPPTTAILNAIESQDQNTSLFLSFSPIKPITPIYVEAYFTEMQFIYPETRSFDMCFGTSCLLTVTPQYVECTAEIVLVQASATNLTIELRPTETTSLPPIISAIEIYTASDPLVTNGTDQNDLDGLAALTSTFDRLKGWSGEPCLPPDTVWQWLGCQGTDPPMVTSINLSGYDLNGTLPDFSLMQALQDIDLSNNSLSGKIPGFLGQLPNLKKLNLSYNDFSGTLPSSISNNKRITYDITGNPNVDGKGSSKATIIGLAVGIPLLVIVIIVALVFWLIFKRAKQGQNQATGPETGNGTEHESVTVSTSMEQDIKPLDSATMQAVKPSANAENGEDCIPVHVLDAKANEQSMVPEMDLDELEELIDQHANANLVSNDDDHYVAVGEQINDQSMVPDMDLEELDEIIQHKH